MGEEASEVDEKSDEGTSSSKWLVWEKISWGDRYANRMGRTSAVKGRNKGIGSSGCWIGFGFILSLSILRCCRGIIKLLRKIRPLGILTVCEKLACKDGPDWPGRSEGPDRTCRGWGGWIGSSGRQIGSAIIGS